MCIKKIKCYTVPRFENLESGFILDIMNKDNWELDLYRKEVYKLVIFHFIFFMFLCSITKTIIYDPGSLSKEYVIILFIYLLILY